MLHIKFKGSLYDFHDVEGDGNCLFNSLSISSHIKGDTGPEVSSFILLMYVSLTPIKVCRLLIEAIRADINTETGKARDIYKRFGNTNTIEDWLESIERDGVWGGYFVSVMVSYIYNVNIETISNFLGSMISTSTFVFLAILRVPTTPSIYLYHHVYKSPRLSSRYLNHYGYLTPNTNPSSVNKDLVYTGNELLMPTNSDKPLEIDDDKSIGIKLNNHNANAINLNIKAGGKVSIDVRGIERKKAEPVKLNDSKVASYHFYKAVSPNRCTDPTDPFQYDSSDEETAETEDEEVH